MKLSVKRVKALLASLFLLAPLFLGGRLEAKNQVLGQIQFDAANKAAKSSGVWVDGQYIGFLKELKGSKKILLLPGKHHVEVRQSGYQNFTTEVNLEPGQKEIIAVAMQRDINARYGTQTAVVKISGNPERAAVFVDKQFVGHIDQFNGPGQGMLLTPGKHEIKVSLPGYQTFETEVTLLPRQKLKLKTNLMPVPALERRASR
ncbi:MAG TPA: PEGA domain-containing protein [Terriglobia bacterium]|nr:PEGA domain-containing protein [Terriglobia bacterium]